VTRGRGKSEADFEALTSDALTQLLRQEEQQQTSSSGARAPRRSMQQGQLGWVRTSGRWWVWCYRDAPDDRGNRTQRSVRLGLLENMTYDDARAAADGLADELLPLAGATCAWSRWCDRYLAVYVPTLRRSSRGVVESVIRKHLRRGFKRMNVSAIRTATIQSWVARQSAAGAAPESVRLRYSVLVKMLRAAKGEGLAVRIPAPREIELPRSDSIEARPVRPFTTAQVCDVLEAAGEPLTTIVLLCGACHLRIGEVLGLRREDMDLAAGRLTVARQMTRGRLTRPKTKASNAEHRLWPPLVEHLRAYSAAVPAGFLFPSPRKPGMPLHDTTVRKQLNRLLVHLGHKAPRRAFHGFRHWFGTEAARAGAPLKALQQTMGHADRRSTERYITVDRDDAEQLAARVGAAFLDQLLSVPSTGRVVPLRRRNVANHRKSE
jgi:integrase